jgi:hypothetical protein
MKRQTPDLLPEVIHPPVDYSSFELLLFILFYTDKKATPLLVT